MLTRWSAPEIGLFDRNVSALDRLRQEMGRVFNAFDREWGAQDLTLQLHTRGPRMALYDSGEALELRAELPGFTDKDINISVEQSSLTIRGERKEELPEGYSVHRQERGNIAFARTIALPSAVDAGKVEATLRNGILELTLPKAAEAMPREIHVKAC